MMSRPRALDLFCGAGGAARGLQNAGFFVVGVDHRPQPRYAGDLFVQGDALLPPVRLEDFDFVWASPPCQASSVLRNLPWLKGNEYPQLIPRTRDMLAASHTPFVIENVPGAPIRPHLTLCGQMFGLPLYRHRIFECSFPILGPCHPAHRDVIGRRERAERSLARRGTLNAGSSTGSWGKGGAVTVAGHQFKKCDGQRAMGIDWMTRGEMAEAVPPAYAEFIGRAAMAQIRQQEIVAGRRIARTMCVPADEIGGAPARAS